jgi:protein-tyrosine phosphatase
MKQVLFLCSANYYRSRFAENLFNWLASEADLPWRADSCGLDVARWDHLKGMSSYTVHALKRRGIPISGDQRNPKRLTLPDLANSDLVVAVKEAEHRQMMRERFPLFVDQIEYWHVDDLDCAEAEEALPVLEKHVRMLVKRLAASGVPARPDING